jgi:hypothetical protein
MGGGMVSARVTGGGGAATTGIGSSAIDAPLVSLAFAASAYAAGASGTRSAGGSTGCGGLAIGTATAGAWYESTDGGAGVFINCDHRVSSAGAASGTGFAVPSISASSAVAASATADAPGGWAAGPCAVIFPPQHSQNCAEVSDWDSHVWQRIPGGSSQGICQTEPARMSAIPPRIQPAAAGPIATLRHPMRSAVPKNGSESCRTAQGCRRPSGDRPVPGGCGAPASRPSVAQSEERENNSCGVDQSAGENARPEVRLLDTFAEGQ